MYKIIRNTIISLSLISSTQVLASTEIPDLSKYTGVYMEGHNPPDTNNSDSLFPSFMYKKEEYKYFLNNNMEDLWTCASKGNICFIKKDFVNKNVYHIDFNTFKNKSFQHHPLLVTNGIDDESKYLYIKFMDDEKTYYMKNLDFPSDSIDDYMKANDIHPFHLGTQNETSIGVKVGGTIGLGVFHLLLEAL